MYDNNYPDTNRTLEDNNAGTQNQHRTQDSYNGQNTGGYYRNTYHDNSYARETTVNPYENRNGYYQRQDGANHVNGTSSAAQGVNSTGNVSGAGTYQYGNTYPNDYIQMNRQADKKKAKGNKKPHSFGYLKKALVCVSLGLLFGIFAGAGLYAVQYATGALDDRAGKTGAAQIETMAQEVIDQTAEMTGTADVIAESGIHVTDSISTVVADVSEVVKEVMPSIVSINNHYTERISYFGQVMTSEADSSGSGIIVGQNDAELLIVTNYHVVEDTEKLTVQFVEGSEAEASIKGTDAGMDLAVIAVPISNVSNSTIDEIAIATLGDSDALVVGEPAIAIGNSLGYGQSVTTGVISALDRSIELSGGSSGTFIQTDAAINPGNSGGALLNMKGEVIGINSNKIGGSAIEGMGYAIPISSASPIIAELMLKETKNKVAEEDRGYLGISGITVIDYLIEAYGMPEGVYISQVYDNTAAAKAGLRKGDIITEFNGEKISSMEELLKELEFHAEGTTVEITVMSVGANGYESREVQLTLGNKIQE